MSAYTFYGGYPKELFIDYVDEGMLTYVLSIYVMLYLVHVDMAFVKHVLIPI